MNELTKRQRAVLRFIIDDVRENGIPPSIREIGVFFGIGSLRGATVHLDALERKGYIVRETSKPRGIKILRNVEGQPVRMVFEVVR